MTPSLDIQGHRGARGLLPENTLPAFARALAIGVTTLELDCAITRDGVVVVSHDSTLNPEITRDDGDESGGWITRDDLAINQFTFDELQRFDVGRINPACEYAKHFPRQQSVDGTRMPKLEDVFALARWAGDTRVRFNIETKISPLHPGRTVPPEDFADALIYVIKQWVTAARHNTIVRLAYAGRRAAHRARCHYGLSDGAAAVHGQHPRARHVVAMERRSACQPV